jgi:hypothetical protein
MNQARRLLVMPLAAACLLLVGCFGFETMVFEDVMSETEGIAVDLKSNPDPEVRAAAAASSAIADQKKAQQSMQRALDNNELDAALEAVELRPLDPYYRLQFGALLVANDDLLNAQAELAVTADLLEEQGIVGNDSLHLAAGAYAGVRDSFPAGSPEWERVHKEYCKVVEVYLTRASEDRSLVDSILNVASYSLDGCP